MRINVNLKNFRNRDIDGRAIENNCIDKESEPKRRKIARDIKRREMESKKQKSVLSRLKKVFDDIKNKLKNKEKIKESLKKTPYAYYFLLVVTVILGIIGTGLNIKTYKELGNEKYSIYTLNSGKNNIDNEDTKTVNAEILNSNKYKKDVSSVSEQIDEVKTVKANSSNVVVSNKNKETNTKPTLSNSTAKAEYVWRYIKPIEGAKISKIFSTDNVIYSATLDMWKIHEGVDFSAKLGTKVIAVGKGKIEQVYSDSLYGVSIILNHGNGYKSIYRNLDKNVSVKEGQSVAKGQKIGIVGNTANSETKDESHLHFEVVKGSDIVNPKVIGIF